MSHPLPREDLERLAKLTGLLGSRFPGERASAAQKATDLIRKHGLTWRDVIIPAALPAPTGDSTIAGEIRSALRSPVINDWERGFLISIRERPRLSQKQLDCLERITRKVNASRRGAPT